MRVGATVAKAIRRSPTDSGTVPLFKLRWYLHSVSLNRGQNRKVERQQEEL
jgi:hypothetical protein